jgi:hypothetical protein
MPLNNPIDVTLMLKDLCDKVESMLSNASQSEPINVSEIDEMAQELFDILNNENAVIATTYEKQPSEVVGFATVYEGENEQYLILKVPNESIGVILWNPKHKGQFTPAPPHTVDIFLDMIEKAIKNET